MTVKRHVVVLHGLAMNRFWMTGVSKHLKKEGYVVHDLSYPSRAKSFEAICDEHVAPLVAGIPAEKVDFVGHSMGGLLVRLYAKKYSTEKIGRVVMLGTPNHGSEVADFLRRWPAFKWFCGDVGQALGTKGEADIYKTLPPVPFECGVIAGENKWIRFITNVIVKIPRPNDGVVSVESTKVEGMKDHTVVFADHSQMVWSPKVWNLTGNFLRNGRFAA